MIKILVSGCYDIVHGGHVRFFSEAKALGDYLIVCVASDDALLFHKNKRPSMPIQHKVELIRSLKIVDEVIISSGTQLGLDFEPEFRRLKPDILAVTEDDKYGKEKKALCEELGAKYVILPKTLDFDKVSTSDILNTIRKPYYVPLRIDFAGGWLDVPKYAQSGEYIVNCSISPLVSLKDWKYRQGAGLGGSAAHAFLTGKNAFNSELNLGVGWQDPAVIQETGLCVWRSGSKPVLELKRHPDMLKDKIALLWLGKSHYTPALVDYNRNYSLICKAGEIARKAVIEESISKLDSAVNLSYKAQLEEGMLELPDYYEMSKKYCGGGFGGYALYNFKNKKDKEEFLKIPNTLNIQPYIKEYSDDRY